MSPVVMLTFTPLSARRFEVKLGLECYTPGMRRVLWRDLGAVVEDASFRLEPVYEELHSAYYWTFDGHPVVGARAFTQLLDVVVAWAARQRVEYCGNNKQLLGAVRRWAYEAGKVRRGA